jgi:hypothetical protein
MKRDSNYKMSKDLKRMLAKIDDPVALASYKKYAIDAEINYRSVDWVILKGPNEKNDKE